MKEFEKIIGYESVKQELMQIADTLKNLERYEKLGAKPPKGLLLHGEPGVGKSLMASCLIEESGLKAYVCRKDKPDGEFINEIKSVFQQAVQNAPSIVFLDDMDKFANGDERHPDAEEYVTVQSCIDEVKSKEVFVLATANSLHCLPSSLLRAGRFDRRIYVREPSTTDAEQIIRYYLSRKGISNDLDIKSITRIMDGHSCAELETVINEAGVFAGYERAEKITMEYFMKAAMNVIFDVPYSALNDTDMFRSNPQLLRRIAYHEAGHVAVFEILDPGSVAFISAFSTDNESGGMTKHCANNKLDPYFKIKISIVGLLAGMAATEQLLGLYDVGSSRDLQDAFDNMHDLVVKNALCGFGVCDCFYETSDDLHSRQEQAVSAEIEKYYRKAKEIIALNREFTENLAAAIMEKKFLSAVDVQAIKARHTIVNVDI